MSKPKQRKIFLPRLSESLPTRSIKITLERENPARTTPNQIPVAPRLRAYIGIRGAMIPNPTMAVNRESGNATNTLLFSISVPSRSLLRKPSLSGKTRAYIEHQPFLEPSAMDLLLAVHLVYELQSDHDISPPGKSQTSSESGTV
jgi:hypothetical protein